jgi:hypothetical protein
VSITNPALIAALSMVLGGVFGIVSERWGTAMSAKRKPVPEPSAAPAPGAS